MSSWLLLLCAAVFLGEAGKSLLRPLDTDNDGYRRHSIHSPYAESSAPGSSHSVPFGQVDDRENESLRFINGSTTQRSPSEDCNICIIEAPGGVSLIYWAPDEVNQTSLGNAAIGDSAGFPYTQIENGFTFTSPSIYVVYSSLQATYACNGGPIQTIGSAYERKTVGYSSRFLAYGTLSSPDQRCDENVVVGGFHTIDFSDLYYHPITVSTTSKAGCPPYVNPRLSMPADLIEIDPAWETCQPLYYGAFDPPRVLTKIGGPLSPLPAHSKPTPVSTHEPISTPATQGPHLPAIPSRTSSSLNTEVSMTMGSSSPHVLVSSQPAAQTNVGFPIQASNNIDSIIPSQASPVEPAVSAPGLPQSAPLPTTMSDRTQVTSAPRIIPILPTSSFPPGADAVLMLPEEVNSLTENPSDSQSHDRSSASGKPNIESSHKGSSIGVALQGAQSEESLGSVSRDSSDDTEGHKPSVLVSGQAGPSLGFSNPGGQDGQGQSLNLANPIIFGLSGPTSVQDTIARNNEDVSSTVNPNGASSGFYDLYVAIHETPAPLAVGTQAVALAAHGAVVVASRTISPGQQTTVDGTFVSVGTNSEVAIGGTTHAFIHPIPLANTVVSKAFASTAHLHTLTAGATTRINGLATTNIGLPAVTWSELTSVPMSIASTLLKAQSKDAESIFYPAAIQLHTLEPGRTTRIDNIIITNTASAAIIMPQTCITPISTAGPHALSTFCISSLITARISLSVIDITSASLATNIASTALVTSEATHVPISTITQNQNSGISGQSATQTQGVYSLVEIENHTASVYGTQGGEQIVTLLYVNGDGEEGETLTRVVTMPAGVVLQLHSSSMEQGSNSDVKNNKTVLGKSSTNPASAIITNPLEVPKTTAATSTQRQTQPPATNASEKKLDPLGNVEGRLVMLLIAMAGYCASAVMFH